MSQTDDWAWNHLLAMIVAVKAEGAKEEREAVVDYLRRARSGRPIDGTDIVNIQAGEHRKAEP